jgi:hypothetical protein
MVTDPSPPSRDYIHTVDDLLQLYSRVDKATASLPTASAMPFLKYTWTLVKLYFALIGDIILIVPINVIVFIRNIFPGRWSYKCFSCRYLKAVGCWIWTGECYLPTLFLRPLTIGLLHWHFRRRLSVLRHQLLMETGFSEDAAKPALAKIDRAMDVWQQRTTFRSIVLVWFLPLMGPVTQAWQSFVPVGLMPSPLWARYAAILSFSYALAFLGTAFLVKRGLMLGATGPDAYYPGFVPGPGGYLQEKTILSSLGLKVREFPLDSAILVGGFLLGFLTYKNQLDFFNELGIMNNQPQFSHLWVQFAIVVIYIPIVVVSWIRRQKLGRA